MINLILSLAVMAVIVIVYVTIMIFIAGFVGLIDLGKGLKKNHKKKEDRSEYCIWRECYDGMLMNQVVEYQAECYEYRSQLNGIDNLDFRFCPYCGRKIRKIR